MIINQKVIYVRCDTDMYFKVDARTLEPISTMFYAPHLTIPMDKEYYRWIYYGEYNIKRNLRKKIRL